MVDKGIVISLIKGHLIHTHLLNGLNELGLHADDYHLSLGDIIFRLMEIDKDELFEAYLEWCTDTDQKMIFKDEELLEKYASEIYEILLVGDAPIIHLAILKGLTSITPYEVWGS